MSEEDLRKLITRTAEENRRQFEETRLHFDVVAEDLRHEIRIVAEGVLRNGEKIDQNSEKIDHLEGLTRQQFEETRSMIRLSYTELDRRLRTLEDSVSSLQSRVDRLESTN